MKRYAFALIIPIFLASVLFPAAGRWDLPFFWAAVLTPLPLAAFIGPRIDPELVEERLKPAAGGHDRHLRALGTLFVAAQLAVAGMDVGRFHWSGSVPLWLRYVGLAGFWCGMAFAGWALITNRFFSPVVRIQSERDHHIITTGPYAFVRHPGYAGMLLSWPCLSLALGSWLSMLFLIPMFALVLRRAKIEDRFLHENLDGYTAYASKVGYRVLPGIW
jgi:protein-S-isoprenylcysteine O-methyltransferase Ste14